MRGKSPKTTLWAPHPENIPQQLAFDSEADELFYGGAAGGGKTDLVLGLACTKHHCSLILRREFPQARSLMDRAREIVGERGRLNENAHLYRLDGGASIEYGSCQYEKNKADYKGRAHDLKAFDEVTEFTKSQYAFIIKWNRSARKGQRCRVISTFNPPTNTEGRWVVEYLAPWLDKNHPNPAKPGELRWFVMIDNVEREVEGPESIEHKGEKIFPRSRTFIPARVTDNPFMGEDYIANLQNTEEPYRSQLLYGDMEVGQTDDEKQLIPSHWIELAQKRWKEQKAKWSNGRPVAEDGTPIPISGIGIDVARGGKDNTVIGKCYEAWVDELKVIPGSQTPTGASVVDQIEKAFDSKEDLGTVPECIDVVGVGAAPYDEARNRGHRIYAVQASGSSTERAKGGIFGFTNQRAEMYWRLREALDPDGDIKLAIPPDPALEGELKAHRYEAVMGKIKIVEKDEVKKILGRSPDNADTLALVVKAARKQR